MRKSKSQKKKGKLQLKRIRKYKTQSIPEEHKKVSKYKLKVLRR